MKVAYIIESLPVGGVEVLTLDILSQFKKRGDVQALMVNLSGLGVKQQDYEQAGIEIISLNKNLSKNLSTNDIGNIPKLRRFFKQYQPDIIHSQLFPANYFSRLAAWGLNIPVIVHNHSIVSDSNNSFRHRFINRKLSRLTSLYISVSKMVYDYTQQELNPAHKPSIVIYNAFNPEKMQVPAQDLGAMYGFAGPTIVQLGSMVETKNFDKTIMAFPKILKAIPSARLLLLGDGRLRPSLEALVAKLELENKVVFTGYRNDVFAYLKSCQLLVMPSSFEGFPIAHLEAMACGLPAVISEHVPSKELAQNCVLFCDTTSDSIAENILKLLSNQALYHEMSIQARNLANKMTIDHYCDSLVEVYNMLLRRAPFTRQVY